MSFSSIKLSGIPVAGLNSKLNVWMRKVRTRSIEVLAICSPRQFRFPMYVCKEEGVQVFVGAAAPAVRMAHLHT
jgi:hypothetical protein